ncbi:peptidoglycan DD-metalloendopeptidase family protein [Rhodoferax sp. 4810]|uniref:Peptidoglycan DD-metalloendopeptidase family protein n=1 Tax=Thiospirillum jenense TaxID=1653858 RepID=A0A839HEC0_9GAMM|nr:peptidoglycan DD-metalloendopeptidase family protein [Thiospirillum jenense]MBB1074325.1 peptidoglycan DD-metalloendopeptidase family protein [Rhodoferax jenense]MBB1126470.1 peptidoglycan DD-metalloendopeptidase family protein [Thiospirillum jenense]
MSYHFCICAGASIAFAVICAVATAAPTPATDLLTTQTQQLDAVAQQVDVLQQTLHAQAQRRDQLYRDLEQNERDIADLTRAGRDFAHLLAEQQQVMDKLQQRRQVAHSHLRQMQATLADLVRTAYLMGRGDRLRLVLNQEDLGRTGRLFGYYQCVSRERSQQVARVQQQTAALDQLQRTVADETDRLAYLAQRQEETRQRLTAAQRTQTAVVQQLQKMIRDGEGRVANLTNNINQFREKIAALRRHGEIRAEVELQPDAISARQGQLNWPVTNPRLLSRFRAGRAMDLHSDGVLIAAPPGSEVHAVHAGQVVFADWLRGFGLLMVLDHGDSYLTLYGHNQTLLKEQGEWVAAGDVIALVGDSGGHTDNGLYFAIRQHGEAINPQRWCVAINK